MKAVKVYAGRYRMGDYEIIRFTKSRWQNLHWRIYRKGEHIITVTTLTNAKWWVENNRGKGEKQ